MRSGFVQVPNVVVIPGDPAWASLVKNDDGTYTLRQTNLADRTFSSDSDELAGSLAAAIIAS